MKLKKKVILTLGREYGSGGHAIAETVGKALDIPVYDKNMLQLAARKGGLNQDYLESEDERLANPFIEPYVPRSPEFGSLGEQLFTLQSKIIREKAEQESCIFVGRCSDDILKKYDDCFHIYVYAPRIDRIKRIMEVEDIEDSLAAEKILKKIDKQRKSYYQFYTDRKWGATEGKDLMINSSATGIDGAAQLILTFLQMKGYIE